MVDISSILWLFDKIGGAWTKNQEDIKEILRRIYPFIFPRWV